MTIRDPRPQLRIVPDPGRPGPGRDDAKAPGTSADTPRIGAAGQPVVLHVARRVLSGAATVLWSLVVLVPVYWIVMTSLRDQAGFFSASPLALPSSPTLDNYRLVWANDFATYLVNSLVVTAVTVVVTVIAALGAGYVIVRNYSSPWARWYFRVFLLGLAIPLQAVIIPVYLIIIRLGLYDTLAAVILPSAAFSIPVSVLIITGYLRDVPHSIYEAMEIDGASEWRILTSLAAPLARPALTTVAVYVGLQVWNGFLFPLILTQSPEHAVLPLALTTFRGQFGVNVPATMAAVVLSTLPVLALFMMARRQLVAGLTAGFTK